MDRTRIKGTGAVMYDLWRELRSQNVGGSEIAALFGCCPYTSFYQLWHEKAGIIEPEDLSDNERIQAGNFMEQGVIDWANHKWNMNFIRKPVYLKHHNIEGMGCTPDAVDSDQKIMAQVKCIDSLQFSQNEKWKIEGENILDAPIEKILQVQHELGCSPEYEESWLIVCINGNRLFKMVIFKDQDVINIIENAVEKFWQSIRDNDPPPPDFEADSETIKRVRETRPQIEYEDFTEDKHLYKLLKKANELSVRKNRMNDELDSIQAEINHIVGNVEQAKCGDIYLTYQRRKSSPDKVITAADVGKTIKGRAGSTSLKITMEGIIL